MRKTLVFDMDGTIVDLYNVENWLADLRSYQTRPYEIAKPLYNMIKLNNLLLKFKRNGWTIAITSWTAKDAPQEYNKRVAKAKIAWLKKYNFPYDILNIVEYGTQKDFYTRQLGGFQILVDDSKEVRDSWTLGDTIDANKNIIEILASLF